VTGTPTGGSDAATTTCLRAPWILPIAGHPIRDGWVTVAGGRIVDLGTGRPPDGPGVVTHDLGHSVLLPGLINAHTHLELSWLWGKVPPAASLPAWVSSLMGQRFARDGDDRGPIRPAIIDALEAGTAAVGDVANTSASQDALAQSRLRGVVFREIVGFNPADPAALIAAAEQDVEAHRSPRVDAHVVPHAPYSVSPDVLRLLGTRAAQQLGAICSIHVGESPDEIELLQTGGGRWRDVLDARGAWNPRWTPPRCGPVEYLDRLGLVGPALLAVHCVQCTDAELARLAAARATIVTCPRSNLWVGVGSPPASRFFASGARVAIGTDSLASASDLNLFNELAALHALAPEVRPRRLLESATRIGAEAIGRRDLGVIAPGARARLITVDLPSGVRDVETYLVEGVHPSQVAWAVWDARGVRESYVS
jgi:cytosine/adenosine deaminase-related metal-dependent hydrolase